MENHKYVKFGSLPLRAGDLLRCRVHPSETYEVEAVEPGIPGVLLDRARLRQVRRAGARRPAKRDLIALANLDVDYIRLQVHA